MVLWNVQPVVKAGLEIKCQKNYEEGIPQPDSVQATSSNDYPTNDNFESKKNNKFYTQVQQGSESIQGL